MDQVVAIGHRDRGVRCRNQAVWHRDRGVM